MSIGRRRNGQIKKASSSHQNQYLPQYPSITSAFPLCILPEVLEFQVREDEILPLCFRSFSLRSLVHGILSHSFSSSCLNSLVVICLGQKPGAGNVNIQRTLGRNTAAEISQSPEGCGRISPSSQDENCWTSRGELAHLATMLQLASHRGAIFRWAAPPTLRPDTIVSKISC